MVMRLQRDPSLLYQIIRIEDLQELKALLLSSLESAILQTTIPSKILRPKYLNKPINSRKTSTATSMDTTAIGHLLQ